jgi:hypothetical protein|tara:strand:+ start:1988 stop:2473 length:486 start_codon:yes stop_codon:yes gene_type:complete
MASRYYSQLDIDTFDRFNRELVGDLFNSKDGIINQEVVVYKIAVQDTQVNMYGETTSGKVFKPGVELVALVDAEDQTTTTDEFGPDNVQNATFSFYRDSLVETGCFVEIGDVINWNDGYWEISSINENQLIGGQTSINHSVVCTTYLIRLSHLNIERVRSI